LALKGLVDTHQGFYRKALFAIKRLVDTHLAFYRILRWHNKGRWIPAKHFIEYLCRRKLVDSHQAFYRIIFLAFKTLVDTHQRFYRISLSQKSWWMKASIL
jgi:hypothetical protein